MPEPIESEKLDFLNNHLGGYDQALGLRFVRVSADEIAAEMTVDEKHLQPFGLVHGGVYAGMVETLCSVGAAMSSQAEGKNVVGLENSTTFLRATRSGTLHGSATPLTRGRRTQVWETRIEDDEGNLLATGRVRLLCIDSGSRVAGQRVEGGPPKSKD